MKNLKIFLLAYLYVQYVMILPMVTYMHMKLTNSFGNWLILGLYRHVRYRAAKFGHHKYRWCEL